MVGAATTQGSRQPAPWLAPGIAKNCQRSNLLAASDQFPDRFALRQWSRKSHQRSERWNQVKRFERPVHRGILANIRAQRHQPRRPRKRIARAMVLKSISCGVEIRIAPEIGQYEHR